MATTRSTLTRLALVGALVAGGVGVYVATRADDAAPAAAASIFKTATVEEGSLGTTEQIDGSVVLSDVTTVLHRIEGQTSSSVNTNTSSSSSSNTAGPTTGRPTGLTSSAATSNVAEALTLASRTDGATPVATSDECVTQPPATVPASPATTSTTDAPAVTTPDTTTPDDTTPATTTPIATVPVTTVPLTTVPVTTPATDCPTTSTIPGGNAGGGGFPTGGGGTLGGGSTSASSSDRITQVVTSVIPDGSPVVLGTVLYSVESSPVVALAGSQPAWRTLDTNSDDGVDIMQLELSLAALGYDPDGTMTIDAHFDSDTKAVVKAWQEGYGSEVTGVVDLGSVVFVGADITVTGTDVVVGDAVGDGDAILSLSAASQQVVIDVPDGDEAYLVPGLIVKIGSGEGTVTLLRSTERDGAVVVQAVITPTGEIEGADNGSTVTVTIALSSLDGVLLVPTEALVSRIDGSYAVQVQAEDGTNSFVEVELLGVSGSSAAIRGDGIEAGTQVMQPV